MPKIFHVVNLPNQICFSLKVMTDFDKRKKIPDFICMKNNLDRLNYLGGWGMEILSTSMFNFSFAIF